MCVCIYIYKQMVLHTVYILGWHTASEGQLLKPQHLQHPRGRPMKGLLRADWLRPVGQRQMLRRFRKEGKLLGCCWRVEM